ncbi:hypothetical protein FNU76_04680 [Chitinimonas arctica]|uniref:Uncharacterized protein n=1 Tax=Chitinimonas arctica TaxID=2594795 RepID=A0A516SC26_9NEIS|nr:hypothetical protein [Chitinimonas arctica]QDQ25702.1 hypothetical protein FNU76_04680 [Chitinimonas arctica]
MLSNSLPCSGILQRLAGAVLVLAFALPAMAEGSQAEPIVAAPPASLPAPVKADAPLLGDTPAAAEPVVSGKRPKSRAETRRETLAERRAAKGKTVGQRRNLMAGKAKPIKNRKKPLKKRSR